VKFLVTKPSRGSKRTEEQPILGGPSAERMAEQDLAFSNKKAGYAKYSIEERSDWSAPSNRGWGK
jgi:hypothetical protein